MNTSPGDRLFAHLPAVFRDRDASGDLARLLAAFEALFFGGGRHDEALPGLEARLPLIPALFSPQAVADDPGDARGRRTPDAFLPWLAAWLSFTPHAHFEPDALRRIVAGIVPLYGLRGTRDYLQRLLQLCFGGEVAGLRLDDRPRVGLRVGVSRVGIDTRLAETRAHWFEVVVELHAATASPAGRGELERRLRAVVDFAKPAHTAYELQWAVANGPAAIEASGD